MKLLQAGRVLPLFFAFAFLTAPTVGFAALANPTASVDTTFRWDGFNIQGVTGVPGGELTFLNSGAEQASRGDTSSVFSLTRDVQDLFSFVQAGPDAVMGTAQAQNGLQASGVSLARGGLFVYDGLGLSVEVPYDASLFAADAFGSDDLATALLSIDISDLNGARVDGVNELLTSPTDDVLVTSGMLRFSADELGTLVAGDFVTVTVSAVLDARGLSASVEAVPIPAAAWLFLTALIPIGARRRSQTQPRR